MSTIDAGTKLPAKFVLPCGSADWHDAELRRMGYQHCGGCRLDVPVWFMDTNTQNVARCRQCLTTDPRRRVWDDRREQRIEAAARAFRAAIEQHRNVPVLATPAELRRADLLEALRRNGGLMTTQQVAERAGYNPRVSLDSLKELADAGLIERVKARTVGNGTRWRVTS